MRLRVACLQFEPLLGRVDANVAKIGRIMSRFNKEIDLLVLPELAVTGYNFKTRKEIEPFLERSGEGVSYRVARDLSEKFKCTTIIGYPEQSGATIYNAAAVVDKTGELVSNYRKSHLYETDETWGCSENPVRGFPPISLSWTKPDENGNDKTTSVATNIGICMDMNPYQFKAEFNAFEFSMSCWENDASLVIVPTAWLASDSPSIQDDLSEAEKAKKAGELQKQFSGNTLDGPEKPAQSLIDYWIVRLFPFLGHPYNGLPRKPHRTTAVLCNRTGIEDQVMYGGSSSILQFNPFAGESDALDATNPSVNVLASAGWASDEVIYAEVEL